MRMRNLFLFLFLRKRITYQTLFERSLVFSYLPLKLAPPRDRNGCWNYLEDQATVCCSLRNLIVSTEPPNFIPLQDT